MNCKHCGILDTSLEGDREICPFYENEDMVPLTSQQAYSSHVWVNEKAALEYIAQRAARIHQNLTHEAK